MKTQIPKASLVMLVLLSGMVSRAWAGLPVLLYDDFDDGDYSGWTVTDIRGAADVRAPDVVASPEGYSVRGTGSGYHPDWACYLARPISLQNARNICIEIRARSGPAWPNAVTVDLFDGQDFYAIRDYGESNHTADWMRRKDGQWVDYRHPIGERAHEWHTFAWTRDSDGWWSLSIDGVVEAANFRQDLEITSFDHVELELHRDQSEIEWVRISGVPEPPECCPCSDEGYRFVTKWGEYGSGPGQFSKPVGVAVSPDETIVYVVDHVNKRLQLFINDNTNTPTPDSPWELGPNSSPWAVAVSPRGNVYVTDHEGDCFVKKFDSSGNLLWTSRGNGMGSLTGIAVVGVGEGLDYVEYVYVCDYGHNRIQKLNGDTGEHVLTWYGDFDLVYAIAISPSGDTVYVTDNRHNLVKVFDSDGNPKDTWDVGLARPQGVAVDSLGNVYVVDNNHHTVKKFSPDSTLITEIGYGPGSADEQLNSPYYVATDSSGNVYISDRYNECVKKFAPVCEPPEGLVAYYPFEGNADDGSGNGNHGVENGGPSYVGGVCGEAISLDGASYIAVPDSPSLDLPGGSGTIAAFIRVEPSSGGFGIVAKESSSSFASTIAYELLIRPEVSGEMVEHLVISDGTTVNQKSNSGGADLGDSLWHHIVGTWNGGELLIYRDGVIVAQVPQTISTINNISEPVLIGAFRWNVPPGILRKMTGDIDEVRIYDRALSACEIRQLACESYVPEMVEVDIKPRSFPNALNVSSGGVLPIAVLGSEDFDVHSIDPTSIRLIGVASIRSSYEDVASPAKHAGRGIFDGPDGYIDLSLKFNKQEIVEAIIEKYGEPTKGQELTLSLEGVLYDETPIEGSDVVVIVGKVPNSILSKKADVNGDGVVNMLDFVEISNKWMKPAAKD